MGMLKIINGYRKGDQMELREARSSDFEQAFDLFKKAYETEREAVDALPKFSDTEPLARERLKTMFEKHKGLVALKDSEVVGYFFYALTGELFGKSEGALVPLIGHASKKKNKIEIYQSLLNEAGKRWVSNNKLSWVVTCFEHDTVLEKLFFKNGFGQRCADAIAFAEIRHEDQNEIKVIKATMNDLKDIKDLHQEHVDFYQSSPLFMPGDDADEFEALKASFNDPFTHIWTAYMEGEAVGYMRLSQVGESFISNSKDMANVNAAYVKPTLRGRHIASGLLSALKEYVIDKTNYTRIGVDYESINSTGSRFWEKHFMPYTKTLARRIDERIVK